MPVEELGGEERGHPAQRRDERADHGDREGQREGRLRARRGERPEAGREQRQDGEGRPPERELHRPPERAERPETATGSFDQQRVIIGGERGCHAGQWMVRRADGREGFGRV